MEIVKNEAGEKTAKVTKKEKMSYEELENIAHQLSEQSRVLVQKLQEANMTNAFKRLDYLFKVIDLAHMFEEEFVTECINEVKGLIQIPEEINPNIEEEK